MKSWLFLIPLFFIVPPVFSQNCNNWAKIDTSFWMQIGNLNVTGDEITIEAMFDKTKSNSGSQIYAGDLVSKHLEPNHASYALRPGFAEVTTDSGNFETPDICNMKPNKTYYVAMVYDGKELKFYRNGFLMSEVPCKGNLSDSTFPAAIGFSKKEQNQNFIGYINEVRIWNVARSQDDIRKYMNRPLPSPSTQAGLLAYYTFDDLKNKQGNQMWKASVVGTKQINQTNPNCNFIADSCQVVVCNVKAGFTYQRTACDPKTIQFNDTTLYADGISWDFGNGQTGTAHNPTVSYDDYGKYIVHLYATTNAGCKDTATDTINVSIQKDSAIITRDTAVCPGGAVQLNAIGGLEYCWSPAITLSDPSIQNPVAIPTTTTTYYLNILVSNDQPVIRDSIMITVIALPVVNAGNDVSVCKGSSVQLNASGANTYNWNYSPFLSDVLIPNPIAHPDVTTNFIVTGYNGQGCSGIDTVKVSVLPLPVISITNDTAICTGGSVMLQAIVPGKNTYNWTPGTGLSNTTIDDPVASPDNPVKYFVTVTDSNNCVSTDSVRVNVLPVPSVSTINNATICSLDSVALITNVSNANSIQWTPASGLHSATEQSPKASPSNSTVYTVVASNGICSEEDSVLISVLPMPNILANNDTTVCGIASVQLNASGASSYTWMPSTGLSNTIIADPVASPVTTTIYTVKGIDMNGCANTTSVNIIVNAMPQFSITPTDTSMCFGDSVLLTASGGDGYNWSPAQDLSNTSSATAKASPTKDVTYSVTVTNISCKITEVLTSGITVKQLPVVTVTKSNDVDCLNAESHLNATGGMSYSWFPATYISSINIPDPVVDPPADTKYIVTVFDGNGCKNQDSILVLSSLANTEAVKFEVANAFTPNRDGLNDCFSVKYWGSADAFDMSIYNRWGKIVFHSNNINNCWDGTYNGILQPSGAYIYTITANTKCSGGVLHKKGTLMLVR